MVVSLKWVVTEQSWCSECWVTVCQTCCGFLGKCLWICSFIRFQASLFLCSFLFGCPCLCWYWFHADFSSALQYNGTYDKQNTSNFLRAQLQEATDGIHILRYHNFVHRREPGEHIKQKVFVTKFGRPHANAKIDITATPGIYDSMTQKFLNCGQPKLPIPNTSIRTGKDGIAEIKMETIDPKRIRRIIDGQGYAHYYSVNGSDLQRKQKELKEGSDGVNSILDFMFLTRVYDNFTVTDTVNWVDHIYPIFRQYAILFPVMRSSTFKMDSYFDVVSHKQITSLSLGLPITHPSYMPATRDLSKQKRKVILDWLAKENPPIGDVRKLLTALYLKERLYTAIEITHSSIPVYFTALWSLKPGYNTQIKKVLTNSVQRSLLHLGLMSNILTAIGGLVNFHYATFRTNYPSALPDGTQPSLVISLEKFSKSFLKNVLLEMKKPDRNALDIGFREVLFNQEVHYRSLCKNKPHGVSSGRKAHGGETNKNCDTFESDYEHHLNSCRHAVKEYLAKSHQAVHDNLNSYLDSKDRDFFNYRSSIGKFYNHILVVFAKLTDCGTNNTIFAYTPDKMNRTHQIYSGMFNGMNNTYGNFLELFKKRIFSVKNYFDVVKAIRLLFTEDQSVTPCDPPKSQEHLTENDSFGKMNDLSQYTMFMSIYKGHAPVLVPSSYEPSKGQGSKRNDKKYVEKVGNYSFIFCLRLGSNWRTLLLQHDVTVDHTMLSGVAKLSNLWCSTTCDNVCWTMLKGYVKLTYICWTTDQIYIVIVFSQLFIRKDSSVGSTLAS